MVIGLLFGLILIIRELRLVVKARTFSLINIFGIMYAITYGFIFSFFIANPNNVVTIKIDNSIYLWHFMAILSFIIIQFVYYYKPIKVSHSRTSFIKDQIAVRKLAFITLIIGSICFYLWSKAYGGILPAMLVGDAIRAGLVNIDNSYSFLIRFCGLLVISSIIYTMEFKKKRKNRILLIISLCVTVFYFLTLDGRFMLIMFLLTIFLVMMGVYDRGHFNFKRLLTILLFAVLALFLISQLNSLTETIRYGETSSDTNSVYDFISREFNYILRSGNFVTNLCLDGNSPFFFFKELESGLFAWLPSSLKPANYETLWHYNTVKMTGSWSLATGETPTDYITSSIYVFGFTGPIIYACVYGFLLRKIETLHYNKLIFPQVIYYYLTYIVIRLVNYSSLVDFMLNILPVFISYVFYKVLLRFVK